MANLLYAWGSTLNGQLGLSDEAITEVYTSASGFEKQRILQNVSKPTLVDPVALLGKYADVGIIRQVKCGADFSAAVMEPTGDVITWGDGGHGQLGTGKESSRHPVKVRELRDPNEPSSSRPQTTS